MNWGDLGDMWESMDHTREVQITRDPTIQATEVRCTRCGRSMTFTEQFLSLAVGTPFFERVSKSPWSYLHVESKTPDEIAYAMLMGEPCYVR